MWAGKKHKVNGGKKGNLEHNISAKKVVDEDIETSHSLLATILVAKAWWRTIINIQSINTRGWVLSKYLLMKLNYLIK